MISDNASTFESAARKLFNLRELMEALSTSRVRWQFMPKQALDTGCLGRG